MCNQRPSENVFKTNVALLGQLVLARHHGDGVDRWQRLHSDLWTVDWKANDSDVEIPSVDPIRDVDPSCDIDSDRELRVDIAST
jgi:hypothetical protein